MHVTDIIIPERVVEYPFRREPTEEEETHEIPIESAEDEENVARINKEMETNEHKLPSLIDWDDLIYTPIAPLMIQPMVSYFVLILINCLCFSLAR